MRYTGPMTNTDTHGTILCDYSLHPLDGGTGNEDGSRIPGQKIETRRCQRVSVSRSWIEFSDGPSTDPIEACSLHDSERCYGGTLHKIRRPQLITVTEPADTIEDAIRNRAQQLREARAAAQAQVNAELDAKIEKAKQQAERRRHRIQTRIERTAMPTGEWAHTCEHCGGSIHATATGRRPKFCSTRCRVAAHRAAKKANA